MIQSKRRSQVNLNIPLFPEKKLRDKTEEVRERRTQKMLDEDEKAREKQISIDIRLKNAE